MSIKTLSRGLLLSALVVIPQALAKNVEHTFSGSPGGTLELHTQVGRISIETHNRDEIFVEVSIDGEKEDEFTVDYDHNGSDLSITGEWESKNRWGGNRLHVEFIITVPTEFNVELHTAGGHIDAEDLRGDVYARTSGGAISVGNIEGDVDLKTSGGSIRTDDIYGQIDAHTSGGSINVTFAKQPPEDATLRTSGGSINAKFPANVQINLDASTSGGRVSTEFDVDGRIKKRSIKGKINGGGPEISLHTSGGSVHVDKI